MRQEAEPNHRKLSPWGLVDGGYILPRIFPMLTFLSVSFLPLGESFLQYMLSCHFNTEFHHRPKTMLPKTMDWNLSIHEPKVNNSSLLLLFPDTFGPRDDEIHWHRYPLEQMQKMDSHSVFPSVDSTSWSGSSWSGITQVCVSIIYTEENAMRSDVCTQTPSLA